MIAQLDNNFIKISMKKTYTRVMTYLFFEGRPITTKGRWVNPIIFFLYKVQAQLYIGKKVYKPIFIIGTGRSGTTILGKTLGIHKSVGFLNEPKALWNYIYNKEDIIGSYSEEEGNYKLSNNVVTPKMKKKINNILGNYLRITRSNRVIDKYPELIFRTKFVKALFPDAHFIFVFRNGYDTCKSIGDWSERLGTNKNGVKNDWWGINDRKWILLCEQLVATDDNLYKYIGKIRKYEKHEYRAAIEWIITMKQGLSLLKEGDPSVISLKYEDYVSDKKVRDKLLDFCELDNDKKYELYCQSILHSVKAKQPLVLPEEIRSEFNFVMQELGYGII